MIRWLRVVMPPGWVFVVAGLFYAVMEACVLVTEWYERRPFFSTPGNALLLAGAYAAAAYGGYRVLAFHPAIRPRYFAWLSSTPWTGRKPLPLGPVHIVGQDVLLAVVVVALYWPRHRLASLYVLDAFLGAYLAALALTLVSTGHKAWGYAVAFGMSLMLLFCRDVPLALAAAAATYAIALIGLRRALAAFPWQDRLKELHRWLKLTTSGQGDVLRSVQESLGWPYARLGPQFSGRKKVSLTDTLLLGLVVGWWFRVMIVLVGSLTQEQLGNMSATEFAILIYSLLVVAGVAGRICIYCFGYMPPLSLLGRLAHGRLIIPGYDCVFVAPLLVAVLAASSGYLRSWTGLDLDIILPANLAVNVWLLLGLGPGLDAWRLTGYHRIVPFGLNAARTT
jgi:hypothetical protein